MNFASFCLLHLACLCERLSALDSVPMRMAHASLDEPAERKRKVGA